MIKKTEYGYDFIKTSYGLQKTCRKRKYLKLKGTLYFCEK